MEGWPTLFDRVTSAYKVSAHGLQKGVPSSFQQSMNLNYVDHDIWKMLYCKEWESIWNQHTYKVITQEYYLDKYSHKAIIPTMNVQVVKENEREELD